MSMNKKVLDLMNTQIKEELDSSYVYLAMSAYFENITLKGFATWYKTQAEEEVKHAMKFYGHILDRGDKIELLAIDKPKTTWKTPIEAAKDAYAHEQYITKKIHNLLDLANKENDYAAASMLKWFVDEQVEEEANALEIVEKLKYVGESNGGLLVLDHHLGKRKSG
jgi:ferritin